MELAQGRGRQEQMITSGPVNPPKPPNPETCTATMTAACEVQTYHICAYIITLIPYPNEILTATLAWHPHPAISAS